VHESVDQVPVGVCNVAVTSWRGAEMRAHSDWVVDEIPVALVFNGISHAVMMTTPCDLDEFALGFSLTEGLIEHRRELYGMEIEQTLDGIEIRLEVSASCAWRMKERRRTLAGRTGCGLCGVDSLVQIRRHLSGVPSTELSAMALSRAQSELRTFQSRQQLTGGSHAAAWCTVEGEVLFAREDVGRHNALDKLVGAIVRNDVDPARGFICVTSRASFEMVQKTATMGVGALAAVSAPTAFAIRCARTCGLGLAGFVRGADFVAYTFPERFGLPGRPVPADSR